MDLFLMEPTLTAALRQLPKESVYRVKGFIRFAVPADTTPSSIPTPVAVDADSRRPWWENHGLANPHHGCGLSRVRVVFLAIGVGAGFLF